MHSIRRHVYYHSLLNIAMEAAETGSQTRLMQTMRLSSNQLFDGDSRPRDESIKGTGSESKDLQSFSREDKDKTIGVFTMGELSMDHLLLKSTKAICERYMIQFSNLTTIQRKFVTNYRCSQCGLLPLYHLDLLHVKRVRCRKCGQLIAFKKNGKYGKLRKEIAFALTKEIQGDGIHALQ